MSQHNPDHVAYIAATLLSGRHEAEPHHVKAAVATARLILDEAHAAGVTETPAAEPSEDELEGSGGEPETEAPAPKPKPAKEPAAAEETAQ